MQNTKNKVFFNMSVLLFPDQYLKRDFFDRLNGLLYWRLGEKRPKTETCQSSEQAPKNVARPSHPVPALLGALTKRRPF
jgi:hypothetical protein